MTVHAFRQRFREELDEAVIKKAVNTTGGKAFNFIDKLLKKNLKNTAS